MQLERDTVGRMTVCDRRELREVSAAVLAVTAHQSVRDVLKTILAAAQRLLDAEYAALGVPDADGGFADFLAVGMSDEQWRDIVPVPRQHGLLGHMLSDPDPVRLPDVRAHPSFVGWPAPHPELTDFLGVPIVDGDEILGELFLANKRSPGGFSAEDEELLRLLAGHAAIALVNAALYERGRELSIVEERYRIARELHDAVTQKLFSLRLTADAAATLIERAPERAAQELATVRRLAAESAAELRAVVVGLHPVDLAGDGLGGALRKQVELLDRVHRASIRFRDGTDGPDGDGNGGPDGDARDARDGARPRLRPAQEETAYRIAQEALHNALRHGRPSTVTIDLREHDGAGRLTLTVTDDGTGFDPDAPAGAGHRLGLASMRDRARAAGGRLDVRSRPGAGTTVRLTVPAGTSGPA
jgi:signal transduction histidine kinase